MTVVQLDEITLERFDHENGWSITIFYTQPKDSNHKPCSAQRVPSTQYTDAEMLVLTGPNGEVGTLDKHQTRGLLKQTNNANDK